MLKCSQVVVVGKLPCGITQGKMSRLYLLGGVLQKSAASCSDFVPGTQLEVTFHETRTRRKMEDACLEFVKAVQAIEPRFEKKNPFLWL